MAVMAVQNSMSFGVALVGGKGEEEKKNAPDLIVQIRGDVELWSG